MKKLLLLALMAALFIGCKKDRHEAPCVCPVPGPLDIRMKVVDNDATWVVSETRHLDIVN